MDRRRRPLRLGLSASAFDKQSHAAALSSTGIVASVSSIDTVDPSSDAKDSPNMMLTPQHDPRLFEGIIPTAVETALRELRAQCLSAGSDGSSTPSPGSAIQAVAAQMGGRIPLDHQFWMAPLEPPPVVLLHQLYSVFPDRTHVDVEIDNMVATGRLRKFKINSLGHDQYALVYTADMAEVILRLLIKLVNASRSLLCSLDSPTTSSTSSSTSSSAQMIRQSQTQSASSTSVPLSSLSFPTPTEARHGSSSLTTTSPSLPSSAPSTSTTSTTPTSTFSSSLDTSPDPFHKMKRRYDEFSEEILEPDPMLGSSACLITESPPLKRNKLDVTASIIPTDQDLSSQMICSTSSAQDTQTSSSRPSSSSTSVSSTSPTTLQFPRDASMSPVTSPTWNCPSAISSPSSISITPTLSLLQDTGLPLRLVVNVLTRFLTDVLPSLTSLSTPRRQLMSMLLADPQHTLNHACDASVSSPSISLAASPVTFFSSPLYHVFLKSIPSSSELDDLEISAQRCLKALSKGGHPSLPLSPLVITPILSQISGSVTVTALDIQRFLTRFTFINPPTTSYDTPFMSASSILSPGSNSSASLSSSIPARHMTSVALTPSLNVSAAASRRRMAGALLSANQSSSTKDTLPSSLLSSISAIDPQPAVYEMCVPMSASIWADTLHGRKELLAAISRTHRGEISERQLFSKYARQSYLLTGSVLPVHFHYRDAVGLGLLTVRQTPLGPVAQVSQKAPSSQDSKLPSSSPTTQVLDDSSTNKSVLGLKPQEDSLGSGRVGASPSTGISGLVPSAALRRKAGLGIPAITRTALAKSLGSHAV